MPMLLIKGFYDIKGSQPDGDTVHFTADDPGEWSLVGGGGGRAVEHSAVGRAKLRLDAVDALETHYGPSRDHQPLQFAHAARDELLKSLGFTDVQRQPNETVTATTPETVPGFVLTRGADVHGRCIALAGAGAAPGTSGLEIDVDVAVLRTTVNHHLLVEGLAYPTFYRSLFTSLRTEMAAVAVQARDARRGLWASDVTTTGAKITGPASLTDDVVILPKLFRRTVDYLRLAMPLSCYPAFLAGVQDRYSVLSTGVRRAGLHHIVEVTNGHTVRMTHQPEDLVFEDA
ncbi:thermonuclease family protein [Streptomyces sp. ID05-47C]|uniref:thermonuclease family protein n=1 Tax=Streptomyces sp. ID05-47C TaxID=3028665 RepID=UPI0029A9711D|nr:thermonuclease family protein [Streptomyces sp. ID05-47C]MDX3570976.1 thermonuclease family protein [Streptomyces sp. ID05-47C]